MSCYPLINRGDRGIERWDPATNIVYFGGLGGTPQNAGITVSHKNFARALAWPIALGRRRCSRAGYGLTWDPLPFSSPLRGLVSLDAYRIVGAHRQHLRLV